MNNENKTIHEFDLNIIYDYFSNTERQGPGNSDLTLKALSFITGLSQQSIIADIGCGTGGPTMVLAQNTPCKIIGVELWSNFVSQLIENARNKNLQHRVTGVVGNMENLPFAKEELDLIWCEGAIYNIGFERGLKEWHKFLKQGGCIAVTENTWLTSEQPTEIRNFWQNAYPEINTISNKVAQMENAGYLPIATFVLPEVCWTDYYAAQAVRQASFLRKYAGNKTAEEFIGYQRYEAQLYDKYKEHYGYVFYIGRKV